MPPQRIEFHTDRLAFLAWQDRHRAPFAAMNVDADVMRYFPAPISPEQSDASIDHWLQQFADKGWSNWAVELRESGEFIGFIGLSVPKRLLPDAVDRNALKRVARERAGRGPERREPLRLSGTSAGTSPLGSSGEELDAELPPLRRLGTTTSIVPDDERRDASLALSTESRVVLISPSSPSASPSASPRRRTGRGRCVRFRTAGVRGFPPAPCGRGRRWRRARQSFRV